MFGYTSPSTTWKTLLMTPRFWSTAKNLNRAVYPAKLHMLLLNHITTPDLQHGALAQRPAYCWPTPQIERTPNHIRGLQNLHPVYKLCCTLRCDSLLLDTERKQTPCNTPPDLSA